MFPRPPMQPRPTLGSPAVSMAPSGLLLTPPFPGKPRPWGPQRQTPKTSYTSGSSTFPYTLRVPPAPPKIPTQLATPVPPVSPAPPTQPDKVAIDCEMIRVGRRSEVAEVAVVGTNDDVLLHEYVRPSGPVTDYLTHITGVTAEKLKNAKSFTNVRNRVLDILEGKEVVGHALENDFMALRIPQHSYTYYDSAHSPRLMKPGPHGLQSDSLKSLVQNYLGYNIQEGEHSAIEDAKASMNLYKNFSFLFSKKEKEGKTGGRRETTRRKRKNKGHHKRQTCRQKNVLQKW